MIAKSRMNFDQRLRFWFSSQSRSDSDGWSGWGVGAGASAWLVSSLGRNSGCPDGVMGWVSRMRRCVDRSSGADILTC